jgi:hypothetical protein
MAGLLSLLAAVLLLAIWYILLFVATPDNISVAQSAVESLRYLLSAENPSRSWFVWLAVAPFVSITLAVAYLSGLARLKAPATMLLVLTVALGLLGVYYFTWSLALFVALPSYWGYLCVRNAA